MCYRGLVKSARIVLCQDARPPCGPSNFFNTFASRFHVLAKFPIWNSLPCVRQHSAPTPTHHPVSPLTATLMDLPASVANKRLTVLVNPLDATYKKQGGLGVLWLTRFASKIDVLTNPGSRRTYPNFPLLNHSISPWQSCSNASSTGAATISRTRSRRAGTSSLVSPLVSMVSCRRTVIFAGQSIQWPVR